MLENILEYERTLFLKLNGAHSLFGDQFMWLFSGFSAWTPAVLSFFIILFYMNRERWKEMLLIVVAIALTITLTDRFTSGLCKPFFARFRPTYHPDFMDDVSTVFGYVGGRFGFMSSHAANGFGFAMMTSLIFRYRFYTILLFLWATISVYSRIYLGVHFISDIIPGIMAGLFFGWLVFQLFRFVHKKMITWKQINIPSLETQYPSKGLPIFLSFMIITVVLIVIVSTLYACQMIPAVRIK